MENLSLTARKSDEWLIFIYFALVSYSTQHYLDNENCHDNDNSKGT